MQHVHETFVNEGTVHEVMMDGPPCIEGLCTAAGTVARFENDRPKVVVGIDLAKPCTQCNRVHNPDHSCTPAVDMCAQCKHPKHSGRCEAKMSGSQFSCGPGTRHSVSSAIAWTASPPASRTSTG